VDKYPKLPKEDLEPTEFVDTSKDVEGHSVQRPDESFVKRSPSTGGDRLDIDDGDGDEDDEIQPTR
jgi:hypothetical protein